MELKKLFELAGVDVTKGKAKHLVEMQQSGPLFATVGLSTEDNDTSMETTSELRTYRYYKYVVAAAKDVGCVSNAPSVIDQWAADIKERTPNNQSPDVLHNIEQFKRLVNGREGCLVFWSIEYDDNVAFIDVADPSYIKIAKFLTR